MEILKNIWFNYKYLLYGTIRKDFRYKRGGFTYRLRLHLHPYMGCVLLEKYKDKQFIKYIYKVNWFRK